MRFAVDGHCRFSTRGVYQTEYRTFGLVEPILQVIYSVLALHLKVFLVSTATASAVKSVTFLCESIYRGI